MLSASSVLLSAISPPIPVWHHLHLSLCPRTFPSKRNRPPLSSSLVPIMASLACPSIYLLPYAAIPCAKPSAFPYPPTHCWRLREPEPPLPFSPGH